MQRLNKRTLQVGGEHTLRVNGRCGLSCWGASLIVVDVSDVAPEEVMGLGGPSGSTGLFPPDADEEGDLTLPCNQPNQRALLCT